MKNIDRRSAIAQLGLVGAALVGSQKVAAQTPAKEGKELAPGIRQIDLSPARPSKISGFKTVSMRDIAVQPGAEIPEMPMENAMLCHMTEGELTVRQDGKDFVAKKNDAWSCGKGTREGAKNNGTAVAVMRVIDLKPFG